MSSNSLISVIVPVYNTGLYLKYCIQSILEQSFTNWELLLVDDGSFDNSLEMCRSYADNDMRICVLHQNNKGVTAARRLGVEHSRGNILCFVDSDDTMDKDALSVMMAKMTDGVDIVTTWENVEKTISGAEYVNRLLQKNTTLSLWGKLYRKDVVVASGALDIRREINIGEDHLGNLKIALLARKVYCLPDAVYIYRDNMQSVWRTRIWSLEYEEMFREEVKMALGEQLRNYKEAWYKFQLYILYDLIRHNVSFSYRIDWIANLLKENNVYKLSIREKIVKYVRNRHICRCILLLGHKLRTL